MSESWISLGLLKNSDRQVAMPDGDIVHSRLRRLYQKPYKWLCEGTATSDECARALLEKLKQDIKAKGDLPVALSQAMADSVAQISSRLEEAREGDFVRLSIEFEALAQKADGRPDLKELTLRAGKGLLNDLRNGREVDITHVSEAIFGRYIQASIIVSATYGHLQDSSFEPIA